METRAAKVAACPCKEARSVFNLPPYKKGSGELQVFPVMKLLQQIMSIYKDLVKKFN